MVRGNDERTSARVVVCSCWDAIIKGTRNMNRQEAVAWDCVCGVARKCVLIVKAQVEREGDSYWNVVKNIHTNDSSERALDTKKSKRNWPMQRHIFPHTHTLFHFFFFDVLFLAPLVLMVCLCGRVLALGGCLLDWFLLSPFGTSKIAPAPPQLDPVLLLPLEFD